MKSARKTFLTLLVALIALACAALLILPALATSGDYGMESGGYSYHETNTPADEDNATPLPTATPLATATPLPTATPVPKPGDTHVEDEEQEE